MFEIVDTEAQEAVIKVIGVGGCGGREGYSLPEANGVDLGGL